MSETSRHIEASVMTIGAMGLVGTLAWLGVGFILSGIFQMLIVGSIVVMLAPGVYRGVYEDDEDDDCDHQWKSNRQAPDAEYECTECGEIVIRD